jgi:hypothetical protein
MLNRNTNHYVINTMIIKDECMLFILATMNNMEFTHNNTVEIFAQRKETTNLAYK